MDLEKKLKGVGKKTVRATIAVSLIIYFLTVLYVIFIAPILEGIGTNNPIYISFLCLTANFIIELLIIIVPVIFLVKFFEFKSNYVFLTAPVLFVVFSIFEPPWWYLFVLTAEWGGGILPTINAMSSVIASLFITAQYMLVIWLTVRIIERHQKKAINKQKICML